MKKYLFLLFTSLIISGCSLFDGNKVEFTVYPDPTTGVIHVLPNEDQIYTVNIISVDSGEIVEQSSCRLHCLYDISSEPSGFYWVKLIAVDGSVGRTKIEKL